jgi:hypothetical protein
VVVAAGDDGDSDSEPDGEAQEAFVGRRSVDCGSDFKSCPVAGSSSAATPRSPEDAVAPHNYECLTEHHEAFVCWAAILQMTRRLTAGSAG